MIQSIMKTVWLILISVLSALHSCGAKEDVMLMELIQGRNTSVAFIEASATFDQAVVDMREKYASVMNITRMPLYNEDSVCHSAGERFAFLAAHNYYRSVSRNASVGVFYPACWMTNEALADLTREWNVPLFVPTGANMGFPTKIERYPNQIRLSSLSWVDFLFTVLKSFGDATAGLLCVDADPNQQSICRLLSSGIYYSQRNFTVRRFDVNSSDSTSLDRSLEDIMFVTRVVIIVGSDKSVRQTMLTAFDKGMTNGNYVYLTSDIYNRKLPTFLLAVRSEERSEDASTAFRSLLTIAFNTQNTSEYHNFTRKVKRLSAEKYGKTYGADEEINPRAVSTYFAATIYGQVLNEAIENGWDTRDGAALAKLIHNRTFTILGNEVIINSNGDRESNWVLNQMDPLTGIYRPILTDSAGGKLLRPFLDPVSESVNPIIWYNRASSPPNKPKCVSQDAKLPCAALDNTADNFLEI